MTAAYWDLLSPQDKALEGLQKKRLRNPGRVKPTSAIVTVDVQKVLEQTFSICPQHLALLKNENTLMHKRLQLVTDQFGTQLDNIGDKNFVLLLDKQH